MDLTGRGAADHQPTVLADGSDKQPVVRRDVEAARRPEMRPLLEKHAALVEDRDSPVVPIGDEEPSLRIDCDRMGHHELPGSCALRSPGADEGPVGREVHDAAVELTIGYEDVARRCD